jgi:lipopolysaccharide transport system permease protein
MNQITIYEPNQRAKTGWVRTWIVLLRNIKESRELIWQLFVRDFIMQFKKSFLGIGWSFFMPLVGMLSWLLYNLAGVLTPGNTGVPYPVYVLTGTVCYGMVGGFINGAANTLEAGRGFIDQVNYHHDALLIKQAMVVIANFCITVIPAIIIMLFFGIIPKPASLLIPLMIIPLFFLCAGIGLPLSLLGGVARDINNVLTVGLTLLLAVTPIVYAPDRIVIPLIQKIIYYNPLTYLVCEMRNVIIFGELAHPKMYLICVGLSFILFLFSWRVFYIAEEKVIEKML